MIKTEYTVYSKKVKTNHTFVMISDFHNREKSIIPTLEITKSTNPDAIFVVGDLVDRHKKKHHLALPFLSELVAIAPTYMSLGNHEIKYPALSPDDFRSTGAVVLENSFVLANFDEDLFSIGGQIPYRDTNWICDFEKSNCFKLLLSHHPEMYKRVFKDSNVDLILSGHAHGGQIRLFDHGVLAPNQGLFPKYTHKFYENKLIVGTGISNTGGIVPRLWNPTEVVIINICPEV